MIEPPVSACLANAVIASIPSWDMIAIDGPGLSSTIIAPLSIHDISIIFLYLSRTWRFWAFFGIVPSFQMLVVVQFLRGTPQTWISSTRAVEPEICYDLLLTAAMQKGHKSVHRHRSQHIQRKISTILNIFNIFNVFNINHRMLFTWLF